MIKDYVAVFGLGYDQLLGVKELKKFNVLGFDENKKSSVIKFVDKYYSLSFKKKKDFKDLQTI